jgi:hypothetical protein
MTNNSLLIAFWFSPGASSFAGTGIATIGKDDTRTRIRPNIYSRKRSNYYMVLKIIDFFQKMCHLLPDPWLRYHEVCEATGLKSRGSKRWLAWTLAATVLLSGCSGVLFESKQGGGRSESLKLDSGEGWEAYDSHPRNPFDKRNSTDEMSIMLKSVKTF